MADEHSRAWRQMDQARGDLRGISEKLTIRQAQLASFQRKHLARLTLHATLTAAPLVPTGIELLFR